MTSPEDDSQAEALRRALSEAVSGVEPGTDGLDKIRARIGGRPPRPWLLSVLLGLADRFRHWTWRGHWAWPDSLPRLSARWERRSRRSSFPRWGIGWLRLVTVLAGIAVIAAITLSVQPFRNAILQASTAGSGRPRATTVRTEGNGTRAVDGSGAPTADGTASGDGQASGESSPGASGKASGAAAHPTSSSSCVTTALPVTASAQPSPTDAQPAESDTASAATAASPVASAPPDDANSPAATCPVVHPAGSPTPTPASTPSPAATSLAPDPADTTPSEWPAPTPTASSPPTDGSIWASPSSEPSPSRIDAERGGIRDRRR